MCARKLENMIPKLLRTNVLAIRCIENFVLVGMGPTLYVFDNDSYQLGSKLDCLYPNNIHDIVMGPNKKLAVFGAKSICICDIVKETEKITFRKQSVYQFNNWIIAVEWILIKKQIQLAILFAHNYLFIYNIFDQSSQVICCTEKCILYGGSLSGTSQEDLVVFSGTVFQEILIWKISNGCDTGKSMPILHRLTGHKGVIFSVIYDPRSSLVCSTSDDRTVRLWKVGSSESTENNYVNWQTAKITLMKTMFSHSARVWRAVIRENIIITIGEDSRMCVWSLSGNLLNKVYAHHGAPIWSIDVSGNNENIFTGGADGSVYVWPVACYNSPRLISLSNNNNMHNIPKYVSFLSSGTILIFNEKGTLLCYNKGETVSLYLKNYCNYCIMQVSPCRSFVAFASKEGHVTIYKETSNTNTRHLQQLVEEKIMESQIFSLQWLRHNTLITCGANGFLRIFNFTVNGTIYVEAQCILPPSRECWLTAAIIYKEKLLICGDRTGNVYTFELDNVNEEIKEPVQTLNKVHGKIGVQSFAVLEGKLITTGRDGMLRFYAQSKEDSKFLVVLYKKKMPMDWISNVLKLDGTVFILGFKEMEFIIYDLLHERILIRVPCGGGHRSWDCTILSEIASFAYIRNKQVYAVDYLLKSLKLPTLQDGFHVKETCCLKHILRLDTHDILISGGEDCALRVSCISRNSEENSENNVYIFRTLGIFDGHLSGIKCISVVKLNSKLDELNNKYLVFSAGGRAQLKVWEINLKYNQRISPSVDLSCSDIKSHMLHGQDQKRGRKFWQEAKQSYVIEPETRYMDIYAYYPFEDLNCVLIFIACADGYLRLFVYDMKNNNIYLKVSTKYVNRCILKMYVLSHESKVIVLTMATDGILRFSNYTDVVMKIYEDGNCEDIIDFSDAPFAEYCIHQSGINSFDLKYLDKNKYLLVTGGDDNLLNLVCFQIDTSNHKTISVALLFKWSTATIHSAQITGLKFKGNTELCSVGVDQQVVIYNYSWSNGIISVNTSNQIFTSVTDVQGMDLWHSDNTNNTMCIYGRGFEVLSI